MGQAAHLQNFASLRDECEIVALAEAKPKQAAAVAGRYGIPRVYTSHLELLAAGNFDAIVAAQPFTRHGVLIRDLATAGVPIFTEKPIASSLAVARQILTDLEQNKTWLMAGYHKRNDPATIYAKQVIETWKQTGEFGKLRYVRIAMPPGDWIASGFNDNLVFDEAVAALECDPPPADLDEATTRKYEAFVNYYIHQVNLLRHLLGEDFTVSYADPACILLIAHSATGIPCTIEMGSHQTSIDWQEEAFVAFERGYVTLRLPAPLTRNRAGQVEVYRDPAGGPVETIRPTLPWVDAMRNQAMNFIQAIRGECPAACLAPEALQDLLVAREYIRLLTSV
ncbi:hypothetical protein BH09VER1_BH09VER1_23200 [soil metagenome]